MNLANLALRIDIEVIPDHFNQKQNLPKSSNIMIQDTLSSGGILLLSNQQVCLDTLKKTSSTTELLGAAITANPTVDEVHQWHLPKTTEIEIHTHTHTPAVQQHAPDKESSQCECYRKDLRLAKTYEEYMNFWPALPPPPQVLRPWRLHEDK